MLVPHKILYISSLSHSGSTLLDLMLNAHSQIVSAGELKQLERAFRSTLTEKPKSCTCGVRPLTTCDFWQNVDAEVRKASGRGLADLSSEDSAGRVAIARDTPILTEAICSVSGVRHIVDSSKNLRRLEFLFSNPTIDISPILLTRDALGQVNSSLKAELRKGRPNISRVDKLWRTAQFAFKYRHAFRHARRALFKRSYIEVRYEQLVESPETVLSAILMPLGLAFEPQQLEWAAHEKHHVGGNRMRRSSSNALILDQSWKQELTWFQKLIIRTITFGVYRKPALV